jgi:hypothetical protein
MPVNQEMLKVAQEQAAKATTVKQAIDVNDVLNAGGQGLVGGGIGAGLGGIAGAVMGGKGNRLRGALRGAATGGLIGGGAGIGHYLLRQPNPYDLDNARLSQEYLKEKLDQHMPVNNPMNGYDRERANLRDDLLYRHGPVNAAIDVAAERANTGLLGGGIAGGLLAKGLLPKSQPKKKKEEGGDEKNDEKTAFAFGQKAAAGLDLSGIQKYLPGAGLGAGAGALVGGLGGLMFPGRRRGRLGGALRGALAGAGLGGLAGGAAGGGVFGQQAQNMMGSAVGRTQNAASDVYKRLGEFYTNTFNPKSRLNSKPQTPAELAAAVGEEPNGESTPPQAGQQELARRSGQNNLLTRHPSAGGDVAMADVMSRPQPGPAKQPAPMSEELRQAYGEEPTGG